MFAPADRPRIGETSEAADAPDDRPMNTLPLRLAAAAIAALVLAPAATASHPVRVAVRGLPVPAIPHCQAIGASYRCAGPTSGRFARLSISAGRLELVCTGHIDGRSVFVIPFSQHRAPVAATVRASARLSCATPAGHASGRLTYQLAGGRLLIAGRIHDGSRLVLDVDERLPLDERREWSSSSTLTLRRLPARGRATHLARSMAIEPAREQAPAVMPVVVAVIDDASAARLPWLNTLTVPAPFSTDYAETHGHAARVAEILAGQRSGVASNAVVLPIAANWSGGFTADSLARSIRYATDHGARVINLSIRAPRWPAVADTLAYARAHGVAVIVAAGNYGRTDRDPAQIGCAELAADPNVLAVAALDRRNPDIGAPYSASGQAVGVSAVPPATLAGTSAAAPVVAGLAVQLLARAPSLSPEQVYGRILAGAEDVGAPGLDEQTGAGRVNFLRTLTGAKTWPWAKAVDCGVYAPTASSDPWTAPAQSAAATTTSSPASSHARFALLLAIALAAALFIVLRRGRVSR